MTRNVGAASSTFPYAAVAYIEATFSDGSRASGTGTLIGRNDVLTSGHVVNDALLGAAESVSVAFGRDGASLPYGSLEAAAFDYYDVSTQVPGSFTRAESELDLALVSLSDAIGDAIGWFELGDFAAGETYHVTGYPGAYRDASGPRLMEDTDVTTRVNGFDLVSLENFDVNPGNSGGPVWYRDPGGPVLVGAVSTGSWATEVSAHNEVLSQWAADNDYLIPPLEQGEMETRFGVVSSDTPVDDFAALLQAEGWALPDALYGELQSRDELLRYPTLESTIDPVIRLYTGMLGREPDKAGVEYWVSQLNAGNDLRELAARFSMSDEFTQLTARLGGGEEGAVEALYNSVLERSPDAQGQAYWMDQLTSGRIELADMVLSFTNSDEYQADSYPFVQGSKLLLWGIDLEQLNPADIGLDAQALAEDQRLAESIVRLYTGILDRDPDSEGFAYWLEQADTHEALDALAESFTGSDEFLAGTSGPTDNAVIDALYQRVHGRAPDAEGARFWQAKLDSDAMDVADLALALTESAEYQQASQPRVDDYLQAYDNGGLVGVPSDLETYLMG